MTDFLQVCKNEISVHKNNNRPPVLLVSVKTEVTTTIQLIAIHFRVSGICKRVTHTQNQPYAPCNIDATFPSSLITILQNTMDKENGNVVVRKNKSSSAGRTPPRLRCNNTMNRQLPKRISQAKKSDRTCAEDEDFSFQKLRGAVKSFEKKQQTHYSKIPQLIVKQQQHRSTVATSQTSGNPTVQSRAKDRNIPTPAKKSITPRNSSLRSGLPPTSLAQTSTSEQEISMNEDFSFKALKQRALQLEGPKSTKNNGEEDFSFQKLKEKAIHGSNLKNTPSRNGLRNKNSAPNTPVRTPAKRSVATTPRTIVSSSKVRKSVPSPHIGPMPMNTNLPICNTTTSTSKSLVTKKKEGLNIPATSRTATSTTFNPYRYKFGAKIKKEEVQATDETIASVQKLSQWLNDDPFEKKKQVIVRRGAQIAKKSRAFEDDNVLRDITGRKESRVEKERQHFPDGKVSQGKSWLKHAFGEGKDVEEDLSGVIEKQRMIQNAFKKNSSGTHV